VVDRVTVMMLIWTFKPISSTCQQVFTITDALLDI